MRILMVVRQFYPWAGGTERQAQKLAARLIARGIDVKVVTGWWQRSTARREVIDSIPVFRNFTAWGLFGLKGLRKFSGYLYMLSLFWYLWTRRASYDLIHVHLLSYPAFPAVLAGGWLGKKTIIKIANSEQSSDIRRMRQNDMLPGQRWMLPTTLRADRLVALSPKIVEELAEAGVPAERICLIPNGVELAGPAKMSYALNGSVTVLFMGRLHPQKALDVLLPAFAQAALARPDLNWRLWLLGEGAERPALEALARQLGIDRRVTFWGQVDDVASYLAQADLFVLPSRAEGMSNALLEAMAHGLPCIASRISGNVDLVRHGATGLLVTPEHVVDLAAALVTLAGDEILRQDLGQAARQAIAAEYSIDSIAQKYAALYRELLLGSGVSDALPTSPPGPLPSKGRGRESTSPPSTAGGQAGPLPETERGRISFPHLPSRAEGSPPVSGERG